MISVNTRARGPAAVAIARQQPGQFPVINGVLSGNLRLPLADDKTPRGNLSDHEIPLTGTASGMGEVAQSSADLKIDRYSKESFFDQRGILGLRRMNPLGLASEEERNSIMKKIRVEKKLTHIRHLMPESEEENDFNGNIL